MWVEVAQRVFLFLVCIGVGWVACGAYKALLSIALDTKTIRRQGEKHW